jgi:hypothetical protein
MERRSSSFAAVRFLDRDAVLVALRRFAESLRRADAEVQSVVLFGSITRRDPRSFDRETPLAERRTLTDLVLAMASSV